MKLELDLMACRWGEGKGGTYGLNKRIGWFWL